MKYFLLLFSILIISVENKGPKPKTTTITTTKPFNCKDCDYYCNEHCDDIFLPAFKKPCINTIQQCKDNGCCERKILCDRCENYCDIDCKTDKACRTKQASCKRNKCCKETSTTKEPFNCFLCDESCNQDCDQITSPKYKKYCIDKKQECKDNGCCERKILCNKCDDYYCDFNCTTIPREHSGRGGDFRRAACYDKQRSCKRNKCCKEKPKATTTEKPFNCVNCEIYCNENCSNSSPTNQTCVTKKYCKENGCCELCYKCDYYCDIIDCKKVSDGQLCLNRQSDCKRNECCKEY